MASDGQERPAPHDGRAGPKGDKRARTRQALLDAALALTREKGFEATTLAEIAARAGVTTGAIYGNFASRDDLFMALALRQWAPLSPKVAPGMRLSAIMAATADALIAALPARAEAAVGAFTFRAYAMRHDAVRARLAAIIADHVAFSAEWFADVAQDDLPMPASDFAAVVAALVEGVTLMRLLTPDLMPDDAIRAAFAALARRDGGG